MATVRQRGDGWQVIVRVKQDGVLVLNTSRTFKTEALARAWGRNKEAEFAKTGVSTSTKLTVSKLLDMYVEAVNPVRALARNRLFEISILKASDLGDVPVGSIQAADVIEFAKERSRQGSGPSTVATYVSMLGSVLDAAKPMLRVNVDGSCVRAARQSLIQLGLIGKSAHRDRRVTPEEEQAILKELDRVAAYPGTIVRTAEVVRFALALPRRQGEIMRLRWEDVDEDKRLIRIRDVKNPRQKVGNDQIVPLIGQSWEILKRQPVTDARVFPFNQDTVATSFERAVKKLKIEDLRFHDLRHEGITRLFELGLSIEEVSMISGHTSWATLRRYNHRRPESIHEVWNARSRENEKAGSESVKPEQGDDSDSDRQRVSVQRAHARSGAAPD